MVTLSLIILFGFQANTLYWCGLEYDKTGARGFRHSPSYFLRFQLDHKNPPTTNEEPIDRIEVLEDRVYIMTAPNKKGMRKTWTLHYTDDLWSEDWYVEDWYYSGITAKEIK